MEVILWVLAVIGGYTVWKKFSASRTKRLMLDNESNIRAYVKAIRGFYRDTTDAMKGRAGEVAALTCNMQIPLLMYFIEATTEALNHYRIPNALRTEMKVDMARAVGLPEHEARGAIAAMVVPLKNAFTGEVEELGMTAFRKWLEALADSPEAAIAVADSSIAHALQDWETSARLNRQLSGKASSIAHDDMYDDEGLIKPEILEALGHKQKPPR